LDVSLLGYQHELLTSTSKKAMMLGGIGSGKSFTGAHFAIAMAAQYPKSNGMITANTYTQLMNATVQAVVAELELLNIPYKLVLSGARKRLEICNTLIYLYSLEKYDNIRGIETGWWLSD